MAISNSPVSVGPWSNNQGFEPVKTKKVDFEMENITFAPPTRTSIGFDNDEFEKQQ